MRIAHEELRSSFRRAQQHRATGHRVSDRTQPSLLRYDYLALKKLGEDVQELIHSITARQGGRALDLGSAVSPYREWIEASGFELETLDIDSTTRPDHVGEAAATGLPDSTFDLVVCTQVLEHVPRPASVMREIVRILKPGGYLVASVPHVWFYHPHPADYWRFTQEGVVELCRIAALEVIELRAQGGSALTLFQAVNFLLYGVLGLAGAPLYLVCNVVGISADRLLRNTLFAHNFAWLARKPTAAGKPS